MRPVFVAPSTSVATSSVNVGERVVVDRRRVARLDRDDGRLLVHAGNAGDDTFDAVERAAATAGRDRAQVPRRCTSSGITLVVVPARTYVIVITTGSNVSMRRVTNVCKVWMISAATGTGSRAR